MSDERVMTLGEQIKMQADNRRLREARTVDARNANATIRSQRCEIARLHRRVADLLNYIDEMAGHIEMQVRDMKLLKAAFKVEIDHRKAELAAVLENALAVMEETTP